MIYTRLDTLETVDPTSPAVASLILYGIAYPSDIIRTSALSPTLSVNRSTPYLRLTPWSKWAVRLIPQTAIDTRAAQLAYLSSRDGWTCFYCGQSLTADTAEIEHIVSTSHGGPTHADNLCLTCRPCNAAAGSLPAVQKVKLAISVRVGRVAVEAFKDQQRRRQDRKRGTK